MPKAIWTLASLTDSQQEVLTETEQALGEHYLLAYEPPESPADSESVPPVPGLRPADLSDSEVERVVGLESLLDAVVVAYGAGSR